MMMLSPERYAEELICKSNDEIVQAKEDLLNIISCKKEKDHPLNSPWIRNIEQEYLLCILIELQKRGLQGIKIAEDFVEICINDYIPFEPRYNSIEMKNRAIIRAALKQMKAEKNKILYAEFGNMCGKDWFYDLENILFYNIGTTYFKEVCKYGVVFCEMPKHTNKEAKFVYRYKMVGNYENFISDKVVVEWSNIPFEKINSSLKPIDYWKKFKENWNRINVLKNKKVQDNFGIEVHIELPKEANINVVAAMKPMLDGIICAFHSADRDFSYFCEELSCDEKQLLGDDKCILSPREYIFRYRNGVKWNPQDDKCKHVFITVSKSDTQDTLISGNIFEV